MSLKQQLQVWSDALDAYEAQDFELCLQLFETIADESKILFNIGLVQATIGSHELAVENFEAAIGLDTYLAVAYYQSGVSQFLLGRYQEARRDFDDAYSVSFRNLVIEMGIGWVLMMSPLRQYLRSNLTIDYEQLGLKFRLYSCEVLFNRGLSSIYMGNEAEGMADFSTAMKEKQTDEHGVIDEAYGDRGDGYTVFSIPVGVLYRPSANKLKNLKIRDYIGKAKLVAATDSRDAFVGFTGSTLASGQTGSFGPDGKGAGSLSRAKTSAARIVTSNDATIAPVPLRRNNTALPTRSNTVPSGLGSAGNLSRSMTMPTGPRPGRGNQQSNGGLPTPPASDEQPLPTGTNRDTAYGGADVIDYYKNADGGERSPLPPMPALPSVFNGATPTPEGQPIERVANWARQNAGAPPPRMSLSRNTSASESGARNPRTPPGMLGRSNTIGVARSGGGFGGAGSRSGGDFDDGYEGTVVSEREMSKSISPEILLEDFIERVRRKFESPSDLPMKYKDVDGAMVSLIDADDWESAMDEARENAKGRAEGKLEIWIE
ncbi:hypothetical protein RQP46_000663 [Phenoliferia psychrophenolica]